jgi:tRNA(Ile)-lysidine synthase
VRTEKIFSDADHLLVAVSGGLDSVVLCDAVNQLGYTFSMAHCNFKLRGAESERDEAFVKQLAEQYKVPVHIRSFDTASFAAQNKCSIQEAARQLRYTWFAELIHDFNDRSGNKKMRLLTAHHLDDNIETLLMNFFKGTGIAGLRAMQPATEKVARPLLWARKQVLEDYARLTGLQWVEDSSNLEDKYARNYFRHQLIPLVEKIYPQVMDNLTDNLDRFRDIEKLYQLSVDRLVRQMIVVKGDEMHIPVEKLRLAQAVKTLLFEIIRPYGFHPAQLNEVLKLLDSQTGKYVLSQTHRILKNRNWLIISKMVPTESGIFLFEEIPSSVKFPAGIIDISQGSPSEVDILSSGDNNAWLDATEIHLPLILRKWKTGDYFYPLGMRKKKKISRFLIDRKRSKIEKENTWVIESDKRIIWVVGQRIDDRFKFSSASKKCYMFFFEPASKG